MEKPAERHLSRDQLERLASMSASGIPKQADEITAGATAPEDAASAGLDVSSLEQAIAHLRSCASCRTNLTAYEATNEKLNSLRARGAGKPGPECLPENEWARVAAGLIVEEKAREYLRHASRCDHCGPLLNRATAAFNDDVTDEEERAFARLNSTTETWQKQLAAKLAIGPKGSVRKKATFLNLGSGPWALMSRWPSWAYGAAAAAMAIATILIFLPRSGPGSPDTLLAQAYSEDRTLEVRFAGARYGPIRVERAGSGQSRLTKSPALLEAEARISRQIRANPDNPVFLDAKGRADLLDGNYDAAIQTFQKALESDPDSVPLLTDAASGYFARAQLADKGVDYGKAIELLGRALDKRPDDPIALYNRALVAEKMFLYHLAVEDWRHYLKLDSKGEWADEANQHLHALLEKLNDQKSNANTPLLGPAAFLRQLDGHDGKPQALHEQIEGYLGEAVRTWLPLAFPENAPPSALKSNDAYRALYALSEISKAQNEDIWLTDLLEAHDSVILPSAVRALAESVRENAKGEFSLARDTSIRAQHLFHQAGNPAGELRAEFETVYALQLLSQDGKHCLVASVPLKKQLQDREYSWLQAQVLLEQTSCWGQLGEFGEAQKALNEALAKAGKSYYRTLYLRALGIAATVQSAEGNEAAGSSLDREGLKRYWEQPFPPIRAYEFYVDLELIAEAASRWHLALALSHEAVNAIALTEQHLGEAFARNRLAKAAVATGNFDLAATQFTLANHLFGALPATEETRNYQADGEIELAKLEAGRGEISKSWEHLRKAQAQFPRVANYFYAFKFYRTLGELQHLTGNNAEAEQALLSAVAVAEQGLASLRDVHERAVWAQDTGEVYRMLAQIKWQSHDIEDALGIWEWYRGAAVMARRKGPQLPNASPVHMQLNSVDRVAIKTDLLLPLMQSLIEEDSVLAHETVLSYLQLPQGLIVWAFNEQGITAKWIGVTPQEMERLARHFREECANPGSDIANLKKDGAALYELLIAPVADRLSPERVLVIEPDRTTAQIPISALIDGNGKYLGESYAIVVSPGLLYQQQLRKSEKFSPGLHALVVGSPALTGALADTLEPLDDATQEAHDVASQFKGAVLLTGSRAELSIVQQELSRAAVFHFAGHAVDTTAITGLLLAQSPGQRSGEIAILDSSRLTPTQLQRMQLAVLSACSTAKTGEEYPGGPENLVTILLRAGVPHVVGSHWNVDSRTATGFMHSFYGTLFHSNSVARSLQIAGAQVRQNQDTAHPYYWASFAAFGR